ncbi:hypothetical protein D3C74_202580 [compost metagenome]
MQYVKPSVLNLGKSESNIKGECGWGVENWTLDKTDAYKTQKMRYETCGIIGGNYVYCCNFIVACSSDINEC